MERLFPDGQLSNPRPVGAMGQPQALVQVPDCGLNVIRWDDWGDPQSSQRLRSILHNPGSPVADAEQTGGWFLSGCVLKRSWAALTELVNCSNVWDCGICELLELSRRVTLSVAESYAITPRTPPTMQAV